MTRVLSVLTRHGSSDSTTGAPPASPPARRPTRAWWRDARVFAGVALIVVSMVIGSRLLASGSETVAAWQATRDLAPGAVVGSGDVTTIEIPAVLAGAYADGSELPTVPLGRALLAGEILPVQPSERDTDARWVTVPVEPLHAPVDLASGERVDVWATDRSDLGSVPTPRLVLERVLVSEVAADGVGMGGEFGVVLQINPRDAAAVISAARSGGIDLVRVPAVTP